MLRYIKGDLIEAFRTYYQVDAIGHCCNCFNNMGSGIAPQIAKAWPAVRDVDNLTVKGDRNKLGGITYVHNADGFGGSVFNLYGQYGFWKNYDENGVLVPNLDYGFLEQAMIDMEKEVLSELGQGARIGFPLIGCGLAGGKWSVVSEIIQDVFNGYSVYIYHLNGVPND